MRIYSAYHRRRYERSALPKIVPYLLLILILVSLFFLVRSFFVRPPLSPIAQAEETRDTQFVPLKPKDVGELEQRIAAVLNESVPSYSIVVDDFLRPFHLEMGDQITYYGASIHKVPILLTLIDQIQQGKRSWDDTVTYLESDRQDYGTGSLRYKKAGGEYTLRELATILIQHSDNTAAYILGRRILGFDTVQEMITSWGLDHTKMEENETTNADINLLFRKLFERKILNAHYTEEALDILSTSIYDDRLPAKLPEGTKIYHKIGTLIAGLHDVGVVVTPHSLYYIGVFTKGVSDEPGATETIANISRVVYDYMEE